MKGKNLSRGLSTILSIILSVALIFSALPVTALAAPRTGDFYLRSSSIGAGNFVIATQSGNNAMKSGFSGTAVATNSHNIITTDPIPSDAIWAISSAGSGKYYIKSGDQYLISNNGTLALGTQAQADSTGSTGGKWSFSNNQLSTTYNSGFSRTSYLRYQSPTFSLTSSSYSATSFYLYQDTDLAVSGLAITTQPSKTSYIEGDNFDPAGMTLTATYNDFSTEAVGPDDCTYSPTLTTPLTASNKSVTINYGGKQASQTISVAAKTVTSIEITSPPTKTTYDEGQSFDTAGMAVTAYYSNNTHAEVTGYSVDPSGALAPDDHSVTITYNGKTATQNITVNALVLDHIAITSHPTKTGYIEGQVFEKTGMVVTAYFTNNTHADITDYTWSPNTKLSTSDMKVTVTYKGQSAEQPITVSAKALDHIAIETAPTKTTYVVGQSFSSAGMVVKAYYTNDLNETVTDYSIDPSTPLAAGATKVTVSYTYSNVTKTAEQAITMVAKALDHIAITTPPTKTAYVVNQAFDPTGMIVTAYYNDDTFAPVTGFTCSPTRTLIITDTKVTVTYGGKSADQAITVATATNAATPVISADTPVVWQAVDIGATASLSVSASVSKGTLTYQWYSNTTSSNSGGTAVGSLSADPTLTLNTAAAGNTFYYCVVTNTDTSATGSQTATAASSVAQVVVRKDAQTPNIVSTSPLNMSAYQNSSSGITVSAYIDSGVLTYQWYSDTTGLNSGGTPVGSASGSPTLTLNTSTIGTTYYYCVVTNTDNAAPGLKTATATSRAAKVDVVSASSKGTLLFTFDDGWADLYTQAYPILNAQGFKGTAYVNSDFIDLHESGIMTLTQAQDLYAHGWDIADHTTNHEDVGVGDQTDQSHLAQLKAMYCDCAAWLVAKNMPRAAYHVAYPSGLYSSDLIRLLKINGFKTGRATMYGQQYLIQNQNEYFTLPVYSLGDTNDLSACLDGIDAAAASGSTLIIMIHKVEPYSGDLVTLSSWLQQVVNRAKTQVNANKLQVMTISEWYAAQGVAGNGQTPPAPSVTNDDVANTVSSLNQVMEYKLDDAATYTMYDPTAFASLNLTGNHTLAVRYAAAGADPAGPDKILTFTKALTGIEITTAPAKTDYSEGTTFDTTNMVVTAHYDDKTTEAVTGYTIDPAGALATTNKKVTVSYTSAGITKTVDQPITVHAKKLASLSITTPPYKVAYVEGNTFSTAGMTVMANYDNNTSEEITGYTTAPTGALTTSDKKVTVSYTYATVTKTIDQPITVNPKSLDHIAITTAPDKKTYIEGNSFDSTGMVVTAYYDNDTHENVTGYTVLPAVGLLTTDKKVTVSYTYATVTKTIDQTITVNPKSLDHIAITTAPDKKTYTEGNTFNSTGMVVTAYYDNGTHEDVLGYSIDPSSALTATATKVTVSYTYRDVTKTVDQSIVVHAKSLSRIEITAPPSKTTYVEGNTFNTTGMVVMAYYDNDTSAAVTGYTVDPSGPLTASNVKVTVSYTYVGLTRTAEQPIAVVAASLDHIAITTEPKKKTYIEGNTFDPSGMVVTAYYNNGMSADVTDYTMTPSGELATTDNKVTVSYTYKGLTRTDDQYITVNAKKLSSIAITAQPTKKTYIEGNLFEPAGMVVTAYYDNGKSEDVTDYTFAPTGELATTNTKVTVSYKFAGLTKTADQAITVNEKALSKIAITTPPLKTTYIEGNPFDPAGMTVTAYYNNGKSETITDYTVAPSGDLAKSDKIATVSYTFAGMTKTADQVITVNGKKLTGILITTPPAKTQYLEEQKFDKTDMVITAYYDNGKHETVTDYSVEPSGKLTTTDTKITVTYTFAGVTKTAEQPITVALKSLNHILITTPPTKTAYIEGNDFDPTDMVVTAYFDNDTHTDVTGYSVTPSGALATTDKKVTVNYGGKTAEQAITVAAKSLDHIAITSAPKKTQYIEGQSFDAESMEVTAYYDNGTSGPAVGFTCKPDAPLIITDTKVTASFTYKGVTKTADQKITVIAKVITSLSFKTHPTSVNYVEGQTFDPAGMVLTATYNDDSSKDVQPAYCTFSINRPLKSSDKTIDVTYESMQVTQSITVLTKAALQLTCRLDNSRVFPIGLGIYTDKSLTHKVGSINADTATGVALFTGLDAGTYYVAVTSVPSPYHVPNPSIRGPYTVAYGQINKQVLSLKKEEVYTYKSWQLKGITATAGTLSPVFDPDRTSYTLLLDEHTAKTTIKPVLADATSKLYIDGKKVSSKTFTMATGKQTKVTVKVQPKTGKAVTYTVTIKRAASTNAGLTYIKASKGTLKKIDAKNYTLNLSKTQTSTTFSLKLADSTAKYSMTLDGKKTSSKAVSMKPGKTRTFAIIVTPQAGSKYAIKYTIKIIKIK